jgi:hypothetical protein
VGTSPWAGEEDTDSAYTRDGGIGRDKSIVEVVDGKELGCGWDSLERKIVGHNVEGDVDVVEGMNEDSVGS